MWGGVAEPADSYFQVRPECTDVPKTRFKIKEECKQMFPVIGSGRFITAPVITENGQPNYDSLVLQEINLGTNSNGSDFFKELTSRGPLDKNVIQWMLTLHQIGLDVNRTDRTLVFYENKKREFIEALGYSVCLRLDRQGFRVLPRNE